MIEELIRIENRGRSTELYVAGLKVGKGIYGISFDQSKDTINNPRISLTIDIKEVLENLAEITPEQLERAKEILKPYLVGYKRTVTKDGNSSMEILR